jgi:hypothetical protein
VAGHAIGKIGGAVGVPDAAQRHQRVAFIPGLILVAGAAWIGALLMRSGLRCQAAQSAWPASKINMGVDPSACAAALRDYSEVFDVDPYQKNKLCDVLISSKAGVSLECLETRK